MTPARWLRGLIMLAGLVALGYALQSDFAARFFDPGWIDRHIRHHGLPGLALFMLAGAVVTAAGFPRQVVAFFGGYAYGWLWGSLAALLAALAGCAVAFYWARWAGRRFIQTRYARHAAALDGLLDARPFTMTLALRLLPVGSNLLTNLAAGVTSIRAWPFFAGSGAGYLPQTLVFALAGSGAQLASGVQVAVGILLFVVSGLLGAHLYRSLRPRLDPSGH